MSSYKSAIVVAATLFLSFNALGKHTEAKLHCKITDQVLLIDKEGKSQRYSGYEDSYSKGDTLIFTAWVNEGLLENEKHGMVSYTLNWNDDTVFSATVPNKLPGTSNVITTEDEFYELSLGNDYIRFAGIFIKHFTLRRYYKDDWSGSLAKIDLGDNSSGFLTMTMDCRTKTATTISDVFDAALSIYQKAQK